MRMRSKFLSTAGLALAVAGCATVPVTGDPAVSVYATAETAPVGTGNEDAADDPAIWRNPEDPAKSLIVGTDKKAGLHVYNLKGEDLFFLDAGLLNNVDLVTLADGTVLVAASDRTDPDNSAIALFRLDTQSARLEPLGSVASGAGEAYERGRRRGRLCRAEGRDDQPGPDSRGLDRQDRTHDERAQSGRRLRGRCA